MRLVRHVVPALIGGLLWAVQLSAQESTGAITGQVIDATTQQPLAGVNVSIAGTPRATVSRNDGGFLLSGVPAGTHRLRATRIGYGSQLQEVTVAAGATANLQISLLAQAAILDPVVVTGYGTQRREAITGSVSAIDATAADVGVVTNVNQLLQGRAAGVSIVQNNGEPGAGAQVRVRGGTSISASNEPLYVVDGVIINNEPTEAAGFGVGGDPPLARSPLNLINPSDIASITVLKDAAATAIYGSRAANGVILIETKKAGSGGGATIEYDGYLSMASPSRRLDLLDANQYRTFVRGQVAVWQTDSIAFCSRQPGLCLADTLFADSAGTFSGLASKHLAKLGLANTDWEGEINRTSVTHNHNLSFAGGSEDTRFRASLNYMNQEGVARSSAFQRVQGRLNATHSAFANRLRLGLNVTSSHTSNDYLTFENTGGFEGGVFQNVAVFNPTQPVTVIDPSSGLTTYYEIAGQRSVRNPVALAEQISDFGSTTRTLGNATAELDLVPGLTAQVNVGVDRSDGQRKTYLPKASPVGAGFDGRSRLANRDNTTVTLQTLMTLRRQLGDIQTLDVVGGYEFSEFKTGTFLTDGRGYVSDGLLYNNPGAARTLTDSGGRQESRQVAFFGRANYGLRDRYFLTGVLRYDGSSRFAEGHKWAVFPAISGSWRISEEGFMRDRGISELRLRAGWGLQGNPGVPPYSSLALLEPTTGARYPFGDAVTFGVIPTREPNPGLKWEQTSQINVAVDYGFLNNRLSGSLEYYVKNTSDLLLEVSNPQPSFAEKRLQNVGKVRNRGLELSLDALALSRPNLTWRAGLVFSAERNRVINLGPYTAIATGIVSGQGQSNVFAQSIRPGHPIGTFFGPEFVRVDTLGQQLFNHYRIIRDTITGRVLGRTLLGAYTSDSVTALDYSVIGNANPDFTLGLHSQVNWGKFDISFLIRASVGQDVFNNTALVYSTKSDAIQDKNFLAPALTDGTALNEPAKFSSRWIEDGSFVRLQNLTVEYRLDLPILTAGRTARLYVSGDNLLLLTGYSGLDPEVHAEAGLASRSIDYLSYPRPRTITAGLRATF
jgi:TonB-dependent starch-binding outer membrane protein SusC